MKKIFLLLSVTLLFGCTHLVSLSTTSIPKNKGKKVYAESERFMFFLFNFDNDYVNELTMDLARQCPKGKVKGILTKHEAITYFPLIAHKVRVSAKGYCVK